MMNMFERLLISALPALRIKSRWAVPWVQRDHDAFTVSARVFFVTFCAAYLAHYYLIDLPLRKEPISLWAAYRFGCALLAVIGFSLTYVKWIKRPVLIRLPLFVIGLAFSAAQAQSMVWRAEVPYVYSIVIPCIFVLALRTSILFSVASLCAAYLVSLPGWFARADQMPYILSAAIVGAIFVVLLRSRMRLDVETFLAEQEKLEAQQNLILAQQEMNEQIRAFLPGEIYRRIENKMRSARLTVLQAADDVLMARPKVVACIHSDIRGFTERSKDLRNFVGLSALPNIRIATQIVEEFTGIPRLIGDLVFGYFDEADRKVLLARATLAALKISATTAQMNNALPEISRVHRFVLVSCGEAVVGNVGGTDASREITVLGGPANILNRLDALTKSDVIQRFAEGAGVVLTDSAGALLEENECPGLKRLDLFSSNLQIRDFPEQRYIYFLQYSEAALACITNMTNSVSNKDSTYTGATRAA